jgi:hypothetical protein
VGNRTTSPLPSEGELIKIAEELLGESTPISLAEIGEAALLDRIDTKYVLPLEYLPRLLAETLDQYRVLSVGGVRLSPYLTQYFDTPEYRLYHAHHSGRTPRYKVRTRRYESTGAEFLEVKRRSPGGRTQKARIPLAEEKGQLMDRLGEENLLAVADWVPTDRLRPTIDVRYTRITLVGQRLTERATIDVFLR